MIAANYVTFFGFQLAPFAKELGDLILAPSPRNRRSSTVADAAESRECCLVTGDPGPGKTCILRAVRHRLSPTALRPATMRRFGKRATLPPDLARPRLSPSATAAGVFYAISSHVQDLGRSVCASRLPSSTRPTLLPPETPRSSISCSTTSGTPRAPCRWSPTSWTPGNLLRRHR
jgi:hypothetical protein